MSYRDEALAAVTEIAPTASDSEFAATAARALIAVEPAPYRIAINHNVNVPAYEDTKRSGVCLLHYTWRHANMLGIDSRDRDYVDSWIRDALMLDYRVSRLSSVCRWDYAPIGGPYEITEMRMRARAREYYRTHPDDDIPF